jgi:hypothetical protein
MMAKKIHFDEATFMVVSFCSHQPLLALIIKKYLPTFFDHKKQVIRKAF